MPRNLFHRGVAPAGGAVGATARPATLPDDVRVAALALGATSVTALVCLLVMFAGVPAAGPVNDVLGAGVGWLALWVAVLVHRHDPPSRRSDLAVAAAALGALLVTWGSYLVVSGTTGWFLAGLVSTLGLSATGAWLLLAHGGSRTVTVLRPGRAREGVLAGALMVVGVLALPGALEGVDDVAGAPWHVYAGESPAWLGSFVMTVWALRLSRR